MLDRLARHAPIQEPVALVVAHPDDEVLGAGGIMPLLRNLLIVHLTDGAPRDGKDARAHGFPDPAAYAAARQEELAAALAAGRVQARREELGSADQEAALSMPDLAARVRELLVRHGARWVVTHPYEGGHPDHDAASLVVRLAVGGMRQPRPDAIEMTSYHAGPGGGWTIGGFLPGPPATTVQLLPQDRERKRAMLACFASQAEVLAPFGTEKERFRPAPLYDYAAPPHPGPLLYEGFGWSWTGERWRALARSTLAQSTLPRRAEQKPGQPPEHRS